MKRILLATAFLAILVASAATPAAAQPARGAVYVASQGLCYDTFVSAETLPDQGPFQLIAPSTICGPGTSMTQFGPGDPGYVGGRWVRPDGTHFLCPLVGGGYPPPQ
ncbi:MAG TPA: hypothetical protein VJP45_08430 [Candidatus Limnocylindria bacterium]|nr:hypothetical protein [Candidatus Limnocylindria bacterium]